MLEAAAEPRAGLLVQETKKIQGVLKTASAPVMSGKLMFFNSSGSGRGLFDVEEDKVVILTHEMGPAT